MAPTLVTTSVAPVLLQHFPSAEVQSTAMHVRRARMEEQRGLFSQSARLVITEQPQQRFRFRYESELGGTHGQLAGSGGTERRSYPTVKLEGWSHPAIIRCELYSTVESSSSGTLPVAHVHTLQGKNCKSQGWAEIPVDIQSHHIASFQGLGIIHTAKKHMLEKIVARKLEEKKLFMQRLNTGKIWCPSEDDISEAREAANRESVRINMNRVCLRFQAFVVDPKTLMLETICDPVYSDPIYNGKSAQTGELKIVQLSQPSSPCTGNREIWLLVERVRKNDIRVRLFEEDENQRVIWCQYGRVIRCHHQYAIIFQTPSYRNVQLTRSVRVFIQLERPSDGCVSEPKPFQYTESEHKSTKRICPVFEYPSALTEAPEALYSDAGSRPDRVKSTTNFAHTSPQIDRNSGGSFRNKAESNLTSGNSHAPSSGAYDHQMTSIDNSLQKLQCTGYPGVIHEAIRHHQSLQNQFHPGYPSAQGSAFSDGAEPSLQENSPETRHFLSADVTSPFQRSSAKTHHLQSAVITSSIQATDLQRLQPTANFNRCNSYNHQDQQLQQSGVENTDLLGAISVGYRKSMTTSYPKMMRMSQTLHDHQPYNVRPSTGAGAFNILYSSMMDYGLSGSYPRGSGSNHVVEPHCRDPTTSPLTDDLKTSYSQNGLYSPSGVVLDDKELNEMLSQLSKDNLNEEVIYPAPPQTEPHGSHGTPVRGMNRPGKSSAATSLDDVAMPAVHVQPVFALDLTNHQRKSISSEKAIDKEKQDCDSSSHHSDGQFKICKNHCLQCSEITSKIENTVLDIPHPPDVALHFALERRDTSSVRNIIKYLAAYDSRHDSDSDNNQSDEKHDSISTSDDVTTHRKKSFDEVTTRGRKSLDDVTTLGRKLSDVVNTYNQWHQTPLHLAVTHDDLTSFRLLLSAGGNPAKVDHRGNTVMHTAVLCGAVRCTGLLLTLPIAESLLHQVNDQGFALFHLAVIIGHWPLIDTLCRHGVEINAQELVSGRTSLHLAVETGNISILRKLLDLKTIDIDKVNYGGETALQTAQHLQYHPMVTALVNAGAAISVKSLEPAVVVSAVEGASGRSDIENACDSCTEDCHTDSDED